MVVELQFLPPLDLLLRVVEPLLDHLLGLSGSLGQALLEGGDAGGVDEKEVAVDFVVVDFLPALHVDVKDANLHLPSSLPFRGS